MRFKPTDVFGATLIDPDRHRDDRAGLCECGAHGNLRSTGSISPLSKRTWGLALEIELRKGAKSVVPLADRAIGDLQQWLIGTYHGVRGYQLQVYLDEFVFRHNRRSYSWLHSRPY